MAGEGVAVLIWKEFWIKYVMGTYCLVKGDQIGRAGERGGDTTGVFGFTGENA